MEDGREGGGMEIPMNVRTPVYIKGIVIVGLEIKQNFNCLRIFWRYYKIS
jgi:hypothetical protein